MAEVGQPKSWVLTFDGQVYRQADLTIGEAEQIEELANTTWRFLSPTRSAKHARAILQTFLVTRQNLSIEAAEAKVKGLKVDEFLDMISLEEEDNDLPTMFEAGFPPEADASTTGT